ncbi:MAG: hypothetical protein GX549_06325, partial [Clostridiales bacterium]|nr:hypothetical protein [Clostridiales bacterium]
NGKFISTALTDEFYAFLKYYHAMFEEGLVDPEGFSQTNEQFYAKLKSYAVGSYFGWTPQSNFDAQTATEYDVLPPLTGPDGQRPVTPGQLNRPIGARTGFAITVDCESPATMLRWFDYCNRDTRTKYTWRLGEEGILWELDDEGKVWNIFPENVTADMTRENMKYTYGMYGYAPCLTTVEEVEYNDPEKYPESVVRYNFVLAVMDYFQTEFLPIRYVSEEKTNEKALLETELNAYLDNFVAQSVMNGIDDAGWQAHLAQMEALGVEQWVKWYQDFIDGNF